MASKFVIRQTNTGTKFDLKAGNGEIILTSEVYTTLAACKKGIKSVQTNAPISGIEDQTTAGFIKEKNPKFELYLDKNGEHRFRLKAKNGVIIGVGQPYKSKAGCMNGIESIMKNSEVAAVTSEGK